MKKARLLSLFLAAVMIASSLPVIGVQAASGSTSPTPYDTELLTNDYLTKSNWGGDLGVTSVDVDNTNKLLRMYNLGNHTKNAKLTLKDPNLVAGNEYTLALYARAQVAAGEDNMQLNLNKVNASETVYSRGVTTNQIENSTTAKEYEYTITTKADAAGSVDFKFNSNTRKHTRPIEIDKAVITYPDKTTKTWDFNEGVYGTQNWSWISEDAAQVSVDWVEDKDYIRVSAISQHNDVKNADNALNGEKAATVTAHYKKAAAYDAGDIKLTPGKYELTFDARQSYYYSRSSQNQAEYEYEYKKLLGENGDKTTVKPARGVNLQKITTEVPGIALDKVYSWDGGASNGTAQTTGDQYKLYQILYYQTNQPFHSNYRDVAVALKDSNGGTIETDTVTVDTEWESYKLTFTVPEGETVTLSDITFGGTGYAYDNDEFDVSNLSLKLVELFFDETPIGSDLLADADHNGTKVSAVYDGYDKNGFISAYRQNWYLDGSSWNCESALFTLKLSEKYNKDFTYFVKFDIRHSVPTNEKQHIVVQLMKTDACNYSRNGGAWTTIDGKGIELTSTDSTWETLTYAFPSGSYSGDVTVLIRRNRGNPRAQDLPVDLDNLVVWKEGADGDGILTDDDIAAGNVLYNENFNDENKSYTATTAVYGNIYNTSTTLNLYHNFDSEYAAASTLEYTGLERLEDAGEGVYIFKADIRVPYFYYYNMRANGAAELGTGDAAKETFLAYNKHTIKVTFTMTDSTTSKEKTVTQKEVLTSMWSTIKAAVRVDEGYKLTGIKVTPVFNSTFEANVEADVGVDFRNVSLMKSENQYSNINIGIIMVLLKMQSKLLGTEDDSWDDPWEDAGFN